MTPGKSVSMTQTEFQPIDADQHGVRTAALGNGDEPIPATGKAPIISAWSTAPINQMVIDAWAQMGGNTGIRTKHTPVFDIDILDEDAARIVEQTILDCIGLHGELLLRVGLAPKRA